MRKHLAERVPLQREQLTEQHPSRTLQDLRTQCHRHPSIALTHEPLGQDHQDHEGPIAHARCPLVSPSTNNMDTPQLSPAWANSTTRSPETAAPKAVTCNTSSPFVPIPSLDCSKISPPLPFAGQHRSAKPEKRAIPTLPHLKRP